MIQPSNFGIWLGWSLEHLEFPNQGRAALQEDDDHEFGLVSNYPSLWTYCSKLFSLDDFLSAIFTFLGSFACAILLTQMNASKQRRRHEILAPYIDDKNPDGGTRAWMELGDKHPDFKYTI